MISRDGSVKLIDFGLASLTRGETLTIENFQGKLAYMSPEQLEHKQLDRRADVFALGTLLYEMLTGERLFWADNDIETLRRVRSRMVEPPSKANPQVPAALDVIVLRALARDPKERYQSAAEMLRVLEDLSQLAAPRQELLRYLGWVAPEVFTTLVRRLRQATPLRHRLPHLSDPSPICSRVRSRAGRERSPWSRRRPSLRSSCARTACGRGRAPTAPGCWRRCWCCSSSWGGCCTAVGANRRTPAV